MCYSDDEIEEDEVGRKYDTHGRGEECLRLLVRKFKGDLE
jgi:hypothetical protein